MARTPDIKDIVDGPSMWGLIIHGLAPQGALPTIAPSFTIDGMNTRVIITSLAYEIMREPTIDREREAIRKFLGPEWGGWGDAWWFEGHCPSFKALPIWGFYSCSRRKGACMTEYVGA